LTILDSKDNSFDLYIGSNRTDLAPAYDLISYLEFCRTIGYRYSGNNAIKDGFDDTLEKVVLESSLVNFKSRNFALIKLRTVQCKE
jgi:hypothetical protein